MSRKVRIVLITMLTIAVCSFLGFTYVNTFVNGQTEHPDLALDSLNDPLLQGQNGHVPDHTYSNEASLNPPNYESTNSGYDLVILINSEMSYFESRKQIRKELFGVVDNLKPCLGYNGRINYKFFVSESDMNIEDLRRLRSEIMEYDDIVTLPKISTWKKEYSMLHWVHSKQTSMEYRHVMLLDSFTYVRVDQILSELDYMTQEATENQQELPILWGNLELERNQTRAIVLGESLVEDLLTIPSLLPLPGAKASIMSRILDNRDNDLVSHIPMISDNRFVEWPNNPHILPKNAIAVTMVYQPEELALITARLQPNQPPLCIDPRPETKLGIITTSFIYKDGCMMDAGLRSATNKRNYAAKHGYYFIARSMEFAIQIYRGRRFRMIGFFGVLWWL
ncbi:hypothetical protein K7432_017763 [Basidiobolus ranarum]|uniref:Uncharacterized protein n=1 Tax=Basidiobolus ranarum TaxID=34480 RepID=A0ABR2VJW7_9FUNG